MLRPKSGSLPATRVNKTFNSTTSRRSLAPTDKCHRPSFYGPRIFPRIFFPLIMTRSIHPAAQKAAYRTALVNSTIRVQGRQHSVLGQSDNFSGLPAMAGRTYSLKHLTSSFMSLRVQFVGHTTSHTALQIATKTDRQIQKQ